MVTEQDLSQGQVADTDLPNARTEVALQFMLQAITCSYLKLSVKYFPF